MKTININGKEYSKDDFFETISIGSYYDAYGCDLVDDIIEDFWDSQNKDFPRHEPEPLKLRPMSELPENKVNVLFLIGKIYDRENKNLWTLKTGYANAIHRPTVYCNNSEFTKSDNWESYSNGGCFLIGWLPLPNPNDIKLPQ